MTKKEQPDA